MTEKDKYMFDHEKLKVYQKALEFLAWLTPILAKLPKSLSVTDQLDRASTSIVMNIPEGNGKFTPKDRCKYFDIARGSTLECAGGLDALVAKQLLTNDEVSQGKSMLKEIVSMLVGLIKSNSDRVYEHEKKYLSGDDSE